MADSRKYILIQSENTLSYNNEKCYVNDQEIEIVGEPKPTPKDFCFSKQKLFYDTFLKRHFKNVVVLTAAGTSLDNGDKDKCGKTRKGLWDFCQNEIDAFKTSITDLHTREPYISKDIEGLLSFLILYEKLNGVIKNGDDILREKLETKIAEACNLKLQSQAPHKDFLNKVTARKPSDPRIQLFTTNYDLLFENAANQGGFVVIDGFSFTQPRKFSGRYFDLDIVNREKTRVKQEESFVSKVFHFYKLHGSLNWFKVSTPPSTCFSLTVGPIALHKNRDYGQERKNGPPGGGVRTERANPKRVQCLQGHRPAHLQLLVAETQG